MSSVLQTRLARLEEKALPKAKAPARVIRLVTSQEEYEAALELAKAEAEALGDDRDDLVTIIRIVVPAPGQPPVDCPARITSKSWV